ncbi:alpha/beta hydrolase [Acrocarpospora macrocephala]|nr:alpha/beta hydrolase [Acrocarpospora macrocephala]
MSRSIFHPDLRFARFLPRSTVGPRSLGPIRQLSACSARRPPSGGTIEWVNEEVSVRVFRPESPRPLSPALLWIHRGGLIVGTAAMADQMCREVSERLGVVAVAVEYRLAPEHPFPTPLEDCYAALRWLARQPAIDPDHIAIGGDSAGGGLAAALALLAKERDEVHPVLQVLSYPMLDDRTTTRTDIDPRRLRIWSQDNNRLSWRAYLGSTARGDVPPLAAPARYEDLSALPPAWIGVGTNDLFHDEVVAYADRLRQAGVAMTLHLVPGAYHGFDVIEKRAKVSRSYRQEQLNALDAVLNRDTSRN